jgi:hypothetical protein
MANRVEEWVGPRWRRVSGIRARVEKSMAGCRHLWRRMRVVRHDHLVQVTQIRTRQFLQGYLLDVIGQKEEK